MIDEQRKPYRGDRPAFFCLCVALWSSCGPVVPGGGGSGHGDHGGGGPGGAPPSVSLSASNITPRVGEAVVLTCRAADGADVESYVFQPTFGRLVVDAAAGVATFIVDAVDVGVSRTFTCAARGESGVGDTSRPVTITATDAFTP